jgi:hypothetical protein
VAQGKVDSEHLRKVDRTHLTAGWWTRKLILANGSRMEKVKQQHNKLVGTAQGIHVHSGTRVAG